MHAVPAQISVERMARARNRPTALASARTPPERSLYVQPGRTAKLGRVARSRSSSRGKNCSDVSPPAAQFTMPTGILPKCRRPSSVMVRYRKPAELLGGRSALVVAVAGSDGDDSGHGGCELNQREEGSVGKPVVTPCSGYVPPGRGCNPIPVPLQAANKIIESLVQREIARKPVELAVATQMVWSGGTSARSISTRMPVLGSGASLARGTQSVHVQPGSRFPLSPDRRGSRRPLSSWAHPSG